MKLFSLLSRRFLIASLIACSFAACNSGSSSTSSKDSSTVIVDSATVKDSMRTAIPALTPQGPKPAWAPGISNNMLVVLEKLKSYNAPPIESLSAMEATKQPTPTTAVMDVMKDHNIPMPAPMVDTMGKDIPVAGGMIHLRIYTPKDKSGASNFPLLVYYHGGGFVIADVNVYDASAAAMSAKARAVVVSVNYRQAPEHKFPAAQNDAFAAYQWVLKNGVSINGDTARIAVMGESAGGNLACNVSIMARDKKIKMPLYQVLIYPVANNDMNDSSYNTYDSAKPLNKPMMAWFGKNFLHSMTESADPRFSLVKANLKGLPPTTIIGAQLDPLQTEGKLLADKLQQAGVSVNYKLYPGVTHEFFGMATVLNEAADAQKIASGDLKNHWNQ